MLHRLQDSKGLYLAPKLSRKHIQFEGNKMKFKLAGQLFSQTVANALDLCRESGFEEFQGSEDTAEFLRKFDVIFDLQNSASQSGRDKKAPFDPKHIPLINELADYIKSIQDVSGRQILKTRKNTGFLGMI